MPINFKIFFEKEYLIHSITLNHRTTGGSPKSEINKDLQLSFSNGYTTQVRTEIQRELFYSFLETIRVIIRLNSRYCCPYC